MKLTGKIGMIAALAVLSTVIASTVSAAQHSGEKPITRAEALERAAAHFDAADKNGDGTLDADEARASRPEPMRPGNQERQRPARPGPDPQAGSGGRDFAPLTRAEAMKQAAVRFDAADKNGDRVLSIEEMRDGANRPMRR